MHAWSYSNDYSPLPRTKMQHAELTKRFAGLERRSRARASRAEQTATEVERCLNCDIADALHGEPVHRVRRLRRRLPGELPDDHARRRR